MLTETPVFPYSPGEAKQTRTAPKYRTGEPEGVLMHSRIKQNLVTVKRSEIRTWKIGFAYRTYAIWIWDTTRHTGIVYVTNIHPVKGLARQISNLTRIGLIAFLCSIYR